VPSADLTITKTDSPDPVRVGANLTYTITVTNAGPNPADAVQVTDTLPDNVTFISVKTSQGSCTGTTTVVCTLGAVPLTAAGATVTIEVQPTVSGTIMNRANATSSTQDPSAANNATTTETVVAPVP